MPAEFPVLGPENSLLRHGLECVVAGSDRYVPLVMVGRSDWGKADCLDYLEKATLERSPPGRDHVSVERWDGRTLEKDLASALESDSLHRLHQRFVAADLVIVDGLDRATKQVVFQAFSALLDRVIESSGRVVVTLEHFPTDVKAFPPSLVSRLSAGLVVAVRMPDGELRIDPHGPVPSIRRIASTTAKRFSMPPACLVGPCRRKNVAHARSTAIFLARRLTGKSLVEIGRFFGDRDHTTVLHSIRVVKKRYETDPGCQRDIDAITKSLGLGGIDGSEAATRAGDAVDSLSSQPSKTGRRSATSRHRRAAATV
jgi:chromosomal replication initiation ATPase DnaA